MVGPRPYGNFFVYLAAVLGNLITISFGFLLGVTPSALFIYKSERTPLSNGPLSEDYISWITTYLCAGAAVGAIFFKHLSDYFGRRNTLMLAGLFQNLGWFGVIFGYNYMHICISRLIIGLSGGGALAVLPIFLTEVSQNKNTEYSYACTYAFQGLGIMAGFIFGAFTDSTITSMPGLAISVLFSLCFPFVQESPYHYMKYNNTTMLEKSIRFFRAIRDLDQRMTTEYIAEVEKFKKMRSAMCSNGTKDYSQGQGNNSGNTLCGICQGFLCCLVMVITAQICGFLLITNYSFIIFENIGSVWNINLSSLILGAAVFIGSLLFIFIAMCTWRKTLISSFSVLIGACLATLGYFAKIRESDDSDMQVIPLICLALVLLLCSASIYPMAFVMVAELFSNKEMHVLPSFFYLVFWTAGGFLIKTHFYYISIIGMSAYFWIFSGACVFQAIVIVLVLPKRVEKSVK